MKIKRANRLYDGIVKKHLNLIGLQTTPHIRQIHINLIQKENLRIHKYGKHTNPEYRYQKQKTTIQLTRNHLILMEDMPLKNQKQQCKP